MKRFYKDVAVTKVDGGWQVTLDGRGVKTPAKAAQVVPTQVLAEALAEEWRAQGEELDYRTLPMRDLADYAIDRAGLDAAQIADKLLGFAETDTLCYRADPEHPLYRRQLDIWEPILTGIEERHGVQFERTSGILHRPLCAETVATLRAVVARHDPFTLAALEVLTALAASVAVGLAALEPDADALALFGAANLEQDVQAERWGWEQEAEAARQEKQDAFVRSAKFARLVRAG